MRKTVAGLFISLDGVIRLGTGLLSLTYGRRMRSRKPPESS
jgi:hypothetical protein